MSTEKKPNLPPLTDSTITKLNQLLENIQKDPTIFNEMESLRKTTYYRTDPVQDIKPGELDPDDTLDRKQQEIRKKISILQQFVKESQQMNGTSKLVLNKDEITLVNELIEIFKLEHNELLEEAKNAVTTLTKGEIGANNKDDLLAQKQQQQRRAAEKDSKIEKLIEDFLKEGKFPSTPKSTDQIDFSPHDPASGPIKHGRRQK